MPEYIIHQYKMVSKRGKGLSVGYLGIFLSTHISKSFYSLQFYEGFRRLFKREVHPIGFIILL